MTYNPNIPLASDLISTSQGQLLTNFSQADTAFGVDHVPFSVVANQGKHRKETLIEWAMPPEATADPVTIANEIAVYSKDVAGITTAFMRKESNGTVIATSGQDPIRASNGSTFLPGDATRAIIYKWGDCGTVLPGGTGVTFASAFPTACFQVFVTVTQAGSNSTRVVTVDPGTFATTGFTAYSSNNVNARYFAIGN